TSKKISNDSSKNNSDSSKNSFEIESKNDDDSSIKSLIIPPQPKAKPIKYINSESLFDYKARVDLSWEEIKNSWEDYFGTSFKLDFSVTKKSIQAALRDIPILHTNETYPILELYEWEQKFKYWLTLFDSADIE
ncbi:19682_t:CDS:2, partial [Funneliformis geosporum]